MRVNFQFIIKMQLFKRLGCFKFMSIQKEIIPMYNEGRENSEQSDDFHIKEPHSLLQVTCI